MHEILALLISFFAGSLITRLYGTAYFDALTSKKFSLERAKLIIAEFQKLRITEGKQVDPITILGAIASVIEIAKFLEDSGYSVTPDAIKRVFDERAADAATPESRLAISNSELDTQIENVVSLWNFDRSFLDRITNKCLPPFKKAIDDPNTPNSFVEQAHGVARRCVCENIKLARKLSGGQFPNEAFRDLWEKFECGM